MKFLGEFTFDEANKLPWSNDLIDFVIASKLLLRTYDNKAPDFVSKRNECQNQYKDPLSCLPEFASNIRKMIVLKQYGISRESSLESLNNFNRIMHIAVINSVSYDNITRFLIDFLKDPYFENFWDGYYKYLKRYNGYLSQPMGGVARLKRFKNNKKDENQDIRFDITDNNMTLLFKYLKDLMDLYYSNCLQCWWAPIFQFANDIFLWSEKKNTVPNENIQVTVDGVLGPIFSRSIEGNATEQPAGNSSSEHFFPEYLLVSASGDNMRKEVGRIFASDFEVILEKWGYHRNVKWKERDFLFLFERLKLKKSVENIAESYQCDTATVQRNTSKLAKLLFLGLPEAPHQFR
jgi:hypothetical protein